MLADGKELLPGSDGTIQEAQCQVITIDVLPDDVLLAIFDFYLKQEARSHGPFGPHHLAVIKRSIEAWRSPLHVCRRWRSIVFGSPHRLNLHLACTSKTPARDMLDVWPALPLIVRENVYTREGLDNIISVLKCSDRVRQIRLLIPAKEWEKVLVTMQEQFPELTDLSLDLYGPVADLPNSFIGGTTPRLRSLELSRISFPGLPKLFLTTTHLVAIRLLRIPHSGYISPEEMVTALFTLASLDSLSLDFESPRSRPDQALRRLPATRAVLPVLTWLNFRGVSEYLDDLVARIDTPRLNNLVIFFFNDIVFDTPQLIRFISRTPSLKTPQNARLVFKDATASIILLQQSYRGLKVGISCRVSDWQLLSLEQVFTSCLPPISTLESLYIYEDQYLQLDWQDNIENLNTLWLELLHPFTGVKNLYLSEGFVPRILPALQELVGGRTTEVLPTLQNIFLEELEPSGPVHEGIGQFVAARQLISLPIAVSRWGNSKKDKGQW